MENKELTPQEQIKAWLEDENKQFSDGFQLFVCFSNNRAKALYLSRRQNMSNLTYELEKILKFNLIPSNYRKIAQVTRVCTSDPNKPAYVPQGLNKAVSIDSKPEVGQRLKITKDNSISYKDLPDNLKALYDKIADTYRQRRTQHEKMKLAQTDEERKEFRKKITDFSDQIKAGWKVIDDYTKGIKPATPVDPNDPMVITKEINAARSFISRVSGLDKMKDSKKQKMILELQNRVEVLIKYNAPVKSDTYNDLLKQGIITTDSKLLVK